MTKYEIQTYRDGGHNLGNPGDDKQWVAEVVELTEPGTEVTWAEPVYATTWHATEDEAIADAAGWLWAEKRRRPVNA
jgi:hypothetical protein